MRALAGRRAGRGHTADLQARAAHGRRLRLAPPWPGRRSGFGLQSRESGIVRHITRMTASPERRSRCRRRSCGGHAGVISSAFLEIGPCASGTGNQGRRGDRRIAGRTGLSRHGGFLRRQDRAHRRASGRAPAGRASRDGGVQGFIGLHFIVQLALPGDFCRITYFCVSEARAAWAWVASLKTAARLARARLRPHRGALPRAPATRTVSITARGMRNRRST